MWSSNSVGYNRLRRSPRLPQRAAFVAVASLLLGSTTAQAQTATMSPPLSATTPAPSEPISPPPPPAPPAASPSKLPHPNRELVWTGASLFALSYLASAISATTGYSTDDGLTSDRAVMWVPAVGPFVMMGTETSASSEVLLALDGLAQIGGLTMFVYGLASSKPMHTTSDGRSALRLSVAPLVTRSASGATLRVTF